MTKSNQIVWLRMMAAGLLLLGLASCGDWGKSRDFNELIPRLMKPVRNYDNPMEAAASLFNVTSPDERRDAIAYLETQPYGHEPAYMKAYYILTTDPNAMVRAQAMRALGSSRKQEAVPYLVNGSTGKTGLADADGEVRRDAARGLQDTYNDSAIPALIDHVNVAKESEDQVRVCCAMALRNAHTPEAYQALILALDDRDAAVVYWARQSLISTTGQHMGFDSKPWLAWYQMTYAQPTTLPAPVTPPKG